MAGKVDPLVTTGFNECLNGATMPGQQWHTNSKARYVEILRKQPQSLRRIPKTVQEENSIRIRSLQVYGFGTGNDVIAGFCS